MERQLRPRAQDSDGEEVFEGATMQFVRANKDDALTAACEEAVTQIDNISPTRWSAGLNGCCGL
jgi:hypothetical protein